MTPEGTGGIVDRSAVSNKEIEEGAGAKVTVVFDDGTAREVDVTAEEAEGLASKGRNVSPWYVHLGRKVTRPGAWILGIAVTSLLIPAITKQWADRPQELQLRISLIDQLGESAVHTVNTARFIVADTLPEASVRTLLCGGNQETPENRAECLDAIEDERRAEQAARIEAKNDWLQKGAAVESQLAAYFPGTELAREGKAYVNAVRIYLFLASDVCGEKRDDNTRKLLNYVYRSPDVPEGAPLLDLTEQECAEKSVNQEFREQYGPMGDRILNRRLGLLRLVSESNAAGFSSGPLDLFWDALPALVVLAAGAVFVVWYAWALRRRYVHRSPPGRQAAERP
jgi:hypothetical protein